MGDSHWTSNIKANSDYPSLTISGFNEISATTFDGDVTGNISGATGMFTGDVTADNVKVGADSVYWIGDKTFLAAGDYDSAASLLFLATSVLNVATGFAGSMYMDKTTPALWLYISDSDASKLARA